MNSYVRTHTRISTSMIDRQNEREKKRKRKCAIEIARDLKRRGEEQMNKIHMIRYKMYGNLFMLNEIELFTFDCLY